MNMHIRQIKVARSVYKWCAMKRPASCTTPSNRVMKRPARARVIYGIRKIAEQKKRWAVARARKKASLNTNYAPRAAYIKRVVAVDRVAREARGMARKANQLSQEAKSESSDARHIAMDALSNSADAVCLARAAAQASGMLMCTP